MNKLLLGSAMWLVASGVWAQEAPATNATQDTATPAATAAPANATASPEPAATSTQPARTARSADRLDLDTTIVTGNRELPKVLYIVPWKKAELGELPAQPFNTLLDEVLQPVDREEFRREVQYFHAIKRGTESAAASPTAAPSR